MTQLSGLLTDDSRTPLEKLRRPQLQRIATANGIKFDPTGPATNLRKLIEGSGVDIMKPDLFETLRVEDENGISKEVVVPIVKPHATANANIDYDTVIEAKAKVVEAEEENSELRKEMAELRAIVAKLSEPKVAENELNEAFYRARYEELFGKKPQWKMSLETIKAKVDAKSQ